MTAKKVTHKKSLLKKLFLGGDNSDLDLEAPEGKYFEMQGGVQLKTPNDLIDALKTMSVEQFDHHTKEGRNDFANWIWFVFEDKALADKIFKAKTQAETLKILEKHYA